MWHTNYMNNYKIELYLILIFFVSLISIISAYFIEHVLGHQPCNLCLIERIPYILSTVLIIAIYIFLKKNKIIIFLLILLFAFSLIISLYHFGIEQNFFEESAICGLKNAAEIISKEEILKQLNEKTTSCKDVTFKIFGFSLTAINILINLLLLIILLKIFKNYEKFQK